MDERAAREIANLIHASKEIAVFTGAGISTDSGIMDFRSEKDLILQLSGFRDVAKP